MSIRFLRVTIATLVLLFSPAAFSQVALHLVLCIDASGSINQAEFDLQLEGTAQAVAQGVPGNGTVILTVIQFGSSSRVEVPPTTVTGATKGGVLAAIRGIGKLGGGTNMSSCINEAVNQLAIAPAPRQVIDISTDGSPTSQDATRDAATAAVAAGVDAINALAVGDGANKTFLDTLVYPQPSGGSAGFVVAVADFEAFVAAMKQKVVTEVSGPGNGGGTQDVYIAVCNLPDMNQNANMEVAALTHNKAGRPAVIIRDIATSGLVQQLFFLSADFRGIALSCEKNAITILAVHRINGRYFTQTANLIGGLFDKGGNVSVRFFTL